MSYELKITLSPLASELIKRLKNMPGAAMKVARAMDRENLRTVSDIKRRISGPGVRRGGTPGEYVGVDTGTLRRSISASQAMMVLSTGTFEVRSSVGSNAAFNAAPVKYAAIHEFGGRIVRKERLATPKTSKLMRGRMSKVGFSHLVPSYTIDIPARPYIGRTVRERLGHYSKAISDAIVKHVIGEVAS